MKFRSSWRRGAVVAFLAAVTAVGSSGLASANSPVAMDIAAAAAPVMSEFAPGTPTAKLPTGVAWGENTLGQLGNGAFSTLNSPTFVRGGTLIDNKEVSVIEPGQTSACAIAVGKLYCWGQNNKGQLGVGTNTPSASPKLVGGALANKQVTAVSVGYETACAIANRELYCWGSNIAGNLGIGNNSNKSTPTKVGGALAGKVVTAVSTSHQHVCAVANAKAYCWGSNPVGEVGDGTSGTDRKSPVAVSGGFLSARTITSIGTGFNHTCAVADGEMACWGSNNHGQLGLNTIDAGKTVPTKVPSNNVFSADRISSLAVGGFNTCVISLEDYRRAFCWGADDKNQVGDGDALGVDVKSPVRVSTPGALANANVSSLSVNDNGGCLVSKGLGYCWGRNTTGRLGNGSFFGSLSPTAVNTQSGPLETRRMQTINAEFEYSNGIAVDAPTFSDIPSGHTFFDDISWQAGAGIAEGFGDGTFKSGNPVSRQAMAAFLFRFKNPGITTPKTCTGTDADRLFADVHTNNQFCGAIEWMVTAGITPDVTNFSPTAAVNRGTLATWLYRAHHPKVADRPCPGNPEFTDIKNNSNCGNIEWLAHTGVTEGYDFNLFKPLDKVSRGAMSAFFHRAAELTAH